MEVAEEVFYFNLNDPKKQPKKYEKAQDTIDRILKYSSHEVKDGNLVEIKRDPDVTKIILESVWVVVLNKPIK